MSHTITLIPGDGIGPEVTEAVLRIFKVANVDIEWDRHEAGLIAFKRYNQSLPVAVLDSIRRNKVALKGPLTTPIAEGFTSVNVGLRKALDLYANLRPVRNLPGVQSRFSGVDLVIVRENTEDLYAGLEHQIVPGVVESLKIITEKASTRVSQFAFAYARANGRKRVTAIHKANIMKLSDGLFLESTRKVSREYTVLDVYADWCGPCRVVDAHLRELIMKRADLAVRKLNLVDFDSPLAKQLGSRLYALPHLIVFTPSGAPGAVLMRVPEAGGTPANLTQPAGRRIEFEGAETAKLDAALAAK